MKFIILTVALCAIQSTYAQKTINKSFPIDKIDIINVKTEYANINTETYRGDQIVIEVTANINLNMDNDSYLFESYLNDKSLIISSKVNTDNIPKRIIYKDEKGNTKIHQTDNMSVEELGTLGDKYSNINYGVQTDITINIKVPENKKVSINSTYGSLVANGIYKEMNADITYGSIDLTQLDIQHTSIINLHSTYGHVDYSIPPSADIEFILSTSYGEILTDLNIISNNKNYSFNSGCNTGSEGHYTLNQGEAKANISATYSNIYLRGN